MNTINRRIKRIGLLPTTFKDIPDGERKVKNAEGNTVIEKVTRKVPIRHSQILSPEERAIAGNELLVTDRSRHLQFRANRKAGFPQAKAKAA